MFPGLSHAYFPDVSEYEWYAKYVCMASNQGIINGYPDGSFGPGKNISFVEAAKIIVNTYDFDMEGNALWFGCFDFKISCSSDNHK